MNKIHNNLNIENLAKTEWFNQFDKEQQNEVLKGLEKNLDISKYAKLEFNWNQMWQIRVCLEANLDISKYANPEIDYEEMNEIRKELLKEKLNGEQNIQ